MAGGVDLEHVHVAALGDLDAGVALTARIHRRTVHAVERPRQDARGRRLAGASLAREHERMRDAVAGDRVAQRARDRWLSDDLVERLRPPFSSQDLVSHRR
jgi:hypothetical protein